MENKKMMKTAKVLNRIMQILQWILAAGCIVCAIFMVIVPIFGEQILAVQDGYINLGNISLALADTSALNLVYFKSSMVFQLIAYLVVDLIGWYGIRLLRQVLAPMKEGRPFEAGIASQIKKLAWVTLVGGAVGEIATMVGDRMEMRIYDLTALFDGSAVAGLSYNYTIDGSFLIGAAVLFLLSYIFHYGEELQRQSDETL